MRKDKLFETILLNEAVVRNFIYDCKDLNGRWLNLNNIQSLDQAIEYARKRNLLAGRHSLNDGAAIAAKSAITGT